METKLRTYLLIKIFDNEVHADAFMQKGEMYCQTLGDFKKIEDGDVRGDAYEGVIGWHQPDQIKSITISYRDADGVEQSFPIKQLAGPLIMQDSGLDLLNVFCMYAVKIQDFEEAYETEEERLEACDRINAALKAQSRLSSEVTSFGKFAVVVYNVQDFIDRVRRAAEARNYACWKGPIKYYNPETFHGNFEGVRAAFNKRDTFSYQSEFRFAFKSDEASGPKLIHVGLIEDIAFKVPTERINELIEIKLKD